MNTKVKIQIEGDMIDGYAELILGLFLMTGILKSQVMSKVENADKSYTLILRAETKKPPLGSLGLKDVKDEYPAVGMKIVQGGLGYYHIFENAEHEEIYSLEAPQFGVLEDLMNMPDYIQAAVLKAAKISAKGRGK